MYTDQKWKAPTPDRSQKKYFFPIHIFIWEQRNKKQDGIERRKLGRYREQYIMVALSDTTNGYNSNIGEGNVG